MKDEEDQYDTPWEYLARPASIRLSSADVRVHAFNAAANGSGPSPSTPPSPANSRTFHEWCCQEQIQIPPKSPIIVVLVVSSLHTLIL